MAHWAAQAGLWLPGCRAGTLSKFQGLLDPGAEDRASGPSVASWIHLHVQRPFPKPPGAPLEGAQKPGSLDGFLGAPSQPRSAAARR